MLGYDQLACEDWDFDGFQRLLEQFLASDAFRFVARIDPLTGDQYLALSQDACMPLEIGVSLELGIRHLAAQAAYSAAPEINALLPSAGDLIVIQSLTKIGPVNLSAVLLDLGSEKSMCLSNARAYIDGGSRISISDIPGRLLAFELEPGFASLIAVWGKDSKLEGQPIIATLLNALRAVGRDSSQKQLFPRI